jgi:hypothetical protein
VTGRRIVSIVLGVFVVVAVLTLVTEANRPDVFSPAPAFAGAEVPAALTDPAPASVNAPVPATGSEPATRTEEPREPVSSRRDEPAAEPAGTPPAAAAPTETPPVAPETNEPAYRIIVTYFHGDVRCVACRRIESYAQEAVEGGFPDDVRRGTVVFQSINVQRPENRHYIQDYRLTTRSVVVAIEQDGTVREWANLQAVWTFLGNRKLYFDYVQGAVGHFLSMGSS